MSTRIVTSFCRLCSGFCGMQLEIDEDGRIASIRGDKEQSMTKGYACFKGLQAEDAHHSPRRLLHPLKRQPDGSFEQISSEQAFDEIADQLRVQLDRGGLNSVALFTGNGSIMNSSAHAMHRSFMSALGSMQLFTTLTIDQSAKLVSFERMGGWAAGLQDLEQSDVGLFFATNPMVSHSATGFLVVDPARRMKRAKARGFTLVVIDPRLTETAKFADYFVQPIPGQDAAIAAALIKIILDEGWHDSEFCKDHVGAASMAALRNAVDPFTGELVAAQAGIEAAQLRKVAELFARDNKRGHAYAATGTNMAPFSNVAQHMIDCLNVICGRFRRAGDRMIVDMSRPRYTVRAEVVPPPRSWRDNPPSRIRGVGSMAGERMTGTLADEILTPGAGQIRAMIVSGANIAASVPDHRRIAEALRALDLLVVVEPYMTPSARMAHYILPPFLQYERPDLPVSIPGFPLVPDNWIQYAPAVLPPPPGSDLVHDWYVFWALAKRLGLQIVYDGKQALDMTTPPTTDELIAIRLTGSPVTLDELKSYPHGRTFDLPDALVQPGPENGGKFDVMPEDVAMELDEFRRTTWQSPRNRGGSEHRFLLSSRRMRDVFCSNGTYLEKTLTYTPSNPVFMHPLDLSELGLTAGDAVEVVSHSGRLAAKVAIDETMKRGVVSMSHGWGGNIDEADDNGPNVNRLVDSADECEAVNAMPWMSAIPVDICLAKKARGPTSPINPARAE